MKQSSVINSFVSAGISQYHIAVMTIANNHTGKMMKPIALIPVFAALFAGAFLSCKKDKDNNPQPGSSYRIKTTLDGGDKKTFIYDNENRLTRIEFSGGTYQLVYSAVEIKAQTYFANGNPDPNWKYLFSVNNNRINGGFRYLPNGAVGRDYRFEYDIDGRLQLTLMRLFDFTGDVSESHRYYFLYDAENNLQQVAYTRENRNGAVMEKADSVAAMISYYTRRDFIRWKQTGFDFFGKSTGGIRFTGLDIIPFSFLFQENIILSEKAIQTIGTKKFNWNQGTHSWSPVSSNNQNYPESDYQYNDQGLPVKFKNISIEWESYK